MAYFLFVDESGHDRKASPYEVLAGIAIRDRDLWRLVNELHEAEIRCFGRRYSAGPSELKGTKILKKKVFQHAQLSCSISPSAQRELACFALDHGESAEIRHLKALALAKLDYVRQVFAICANYGCRVFASMVETDAPGTTTDGLRKDYAYLFQRFHHFLEEQHSAESGIIVFDELEKSQSHILTGQMHRYFKDTAIGRSRASYIVPEPLFVHSDLTTGIQIADLVAYCLSWGFRTPRMSKAFRPELQDYVNQIRNMRMSWQKMINGSQRTVWSIAHITDLRTQLERVGDE